MNRAANGPGTDPRLVKKALQIAATAAPASNTPRAAREKNASNIAVVSVTFTKGSIGVLDLVSYTKVTCKLFEANRKK